ncbi:hypothetical protein PI124_g6681 [Phytophthora idaei]|nr:hypothetical protein PI125_g6292 [Phytophthora idaei]KAG3162204.1 hypothetical protein PI126_g6074 [Phytophthora idaei]KAG3248638.1 hypothetical protein PI124_g6681 [Phytophthora idaei]
MASPMASPMLPGYDPAKMMEYLGKLPAEEHKKLLEEAARQVKDDAQRAQRARTREGLIERFKKGRAQFVRPGGIFADQLAAGQITPDTVQVAFANNGDAKPNLDMKSLKSLKPMIIKELTLGTTHRGRYLCGWVAIDDAFFGIASTSLLLEDVTGQLVEIAAYGLVDPDLPPYEKQHIVASRFPRGQPVVVFEPYHKVRQDMSEGIRVEQPKELIPWKKVPRDLATWKKLGNAFFGVLNTSNEGRGALACYERAMQMVAADVKKIAVLLNNMATCRFKLGEFDTVVQLADADTWRKAGSDCFIKGDYCAAEECYQKGLKALNLSSRDVSLVLNNIAAVHLTLHHETSSVPGISVAEISTTSAKADDRVPSTELALINCTIAGIIDPLNHKAWSRRARCLQKIGYTQAKCIADLNSIRASVVSKALSSAESRARVQEFKDGMGTDVELRSMQASTPQTVQRVSTVSTDVQRKERDALQPDNIASATLHEEM